MCRFHSLSHNVGVVKPFETVTVIKGYANKLDLRRVDASEAPSVHIAHCTGFYLCKAGSATRVESLFLFRWKKTFLLTCSHSLALF